MRFPSFSFFISIHFLNWMMEILEPNFLIKHTQGPAERASEISEMRFGGLKVAFYYGLFTPSHSLTCFSFDVSGQELSLPAHPTSDSSSKLASEVDSFPDSPDYHTILFLSLSQLTQIHNPANPDGQMREKWAAPLSYLITSSAGTKPLSLSNCEGQVVSFRWLTGRSRGVITDKSLVPPHYSPQTCVINQRNFSTQLWATFSGKISLLLLILWSWEHFQFVPLVRPNMMKNNPAPDPSVTRCVAGLITQLFSQPFGSEKNPPRPFTTTLFPSFSHPNKLGGCGIKTGWVGISKERTLGDLVITQL